MYPPGRKKEEGSVSEGKNSKRDLVPGILVDETRFALFERAGMTPSSKDNEINTIGVIGAGGWGTALANLLADKGLEVDLWVREEDVFRQIRDERVNATFLPGVELVPSLRPVRSFEEALSGKDLILLAVPSHVYREVLEGLKPFFRAGMLSRLFVS